MTQLSRRGFLGLAASATAGLVASAALDPERLLWVPGQRKLFLPPERTLVQARTLQEALSKGLTALFPDRSRMKIVLGPGSVTWGAFGGSPFTVIPFKGVTSLEDMIRREIAAIEGQGGRVIKIADLHVAMDDPLGNLQPGWNW